MRWKIQPLATCKAWVRPMLPVISHCLPCLFDGKACAGDEDTVLSLMKSVMSYNDYNSLSRRSMSVLLLSSSLESN